MFDVKKLQAEAEKEVADELAAAAKIKIKASLKAIAQAKTVLSNLEAEHAALLKAIGTP